MVDDPAVLRRGLTLSGLTFAELWVRYYGLGGTGAPDELEEFLDGSGTIPDGQYNVIAHALNERFLEMNLDHPVPYSSQ